MKSYLKILILLTVLVGLTFIYFARYTYIKVGADSILFLNPFQTDQLDFEGNNEKGELFLNKGDTLMAKKYFKKALTYNGTHNEKQRENIYSCTNAYLEYKLDKLLKYSKAYEIIGEFDSAISCLEFGLTSFEKWHYPIDKRFFSLQVKKYGKDKTIKQLNIALDKINELECYYCCSFYFYFDNYRVGIDEIEFEQSKSDRNGLIKKLLLKYEI